jgi:hypothetical protein
VKPNEATIVRFLVGESCFSRVETAKAAKIAKTAQRSYFEFSLAAFFALFAFFAVQMSRRKV